MPDMVSLCRVSSIMVCELCLDGGGGECHTPGCLFWMQDGPRFNLRERVKDQGGRAVHVAYKRKEHGRDSIRR